MVKNMRRMLGARKQDLLTIVEDWNTVHCQSNLVISTDMCLGLKFLLEPFTEGCGHGCTMKRTSSYCSS